MEIDIQARTDVSISPGDLHFVLDGLVDTPVDFQNIPLFELESAVQSNLFVYPEVTASYVAPGTANIYTRGIRLGYPPLDVRSQDVSTDFSLDHTITAVRVALDPTVVLTPVQVFAAQSCSFRDYDGLGSVEGALALYDQVPNFSELDSIEPGLLLGTDRSEWTDFGPTTLPAKSQTWLSTDLQEYQPLRFAGSGYYTPDWSGATAVSSFALCDLGSSRRTIRTTRRDIRRALITRGGMSPRRIRKAYVETFTPN